MKRVTSLLLGLGLAAFTSTTSAQDLTWTGCKTTSTAFMSQLASTYQKTTGLQIALSTENSTAGIRQTASGKTDFGGTSRQTTADQVEQRARLHPVAWDAIVAVVHPENSVNTISLDQLKQVMTGQLTNWTELGGKNQPIVVYTRKGNLTGIGRTARELLFGNPEAKLHSTQSFVSSAGIKRVMRNSKYSIALNAFSASQQDNLKVLQLDNMTATSSSIASGTYKLAHPLYLVTTRQPTPDVKKFVMWVQSPTGQSIIEAHGTVSLRQGNRLWLPYRNHMNRLVTNAATQ